MARIVLTAGGTGGHVFPAEALAAELLDRGHDLTLVTDLRGAEYGGILGKLKTERVRAGQVAGRGKVGQLLGLLDILRGAMQARGLLARLKPACVVGFGGYASLPAMLAAERLKLPTVLHEQNGVLGRANRLLAGRVSILATHLERVGRVPPDARTERVGIPVRAAIAAVREAPYPAVTAGAPLRLFVMGGSQGARVLSDVVPAALAALPGHLRSRLEIAQQCRAEDLERVRDAYDAAGLSRATLRTFFDDVPTRIAEAHLLITRAGASTIGEATVAGRPAILVPYPHATDDHQTANARAMEATGGAWLLPQEQFTVEALSALLTDLFEAPETLAAAAEAARAFGIPDAAARLADVVERAAGLAPASAARGAKEDSKTRETAQ